MLSLNRSPITYIPLSHKEENTGEPMPAGMSGFWVIGESEDLIFFLTRYLVKSCQTLTLFYIMRLLFTSEFILVASHVIKLQGECG